MKRIKWTTAITAVAVLALATAAVVTTEAVSAQRTGRHIGGRFGDRLGIRALASHGDGLGGAGIGKMMFERIHEFMSLRDDLNLTEEQQAQLAEVREAWRPVMEPQVQAVMDAKEALMDAVLAEPADEAAIQAAAAALGDALSAAAVQASLAVGDARQILTAEQLAVLEDFRASRLDNRDTRREELRNAFQQFREQRAE